MPQMDLRGPDDRRRRQREELSVLYFRLCFVIFLLSDSTERCRQDMWGEIEKLMAHKSLTGFKLGALWFVVPVLDQEATTGSQYGFISQKFRFWRQQNYPFSVPISPNFQNISL